MNVFEALAANPNLDPDASIVWDMVQTAREAGWHFSSNPISHWMWTCEAENIAVGMNNAPIGPAVYMATSNRKQAVKSLLFYARKAGLLPPAGTDATRKTS